MRLVDEFRDAGVAERILERIRARVTRSWRIMEICGGQTHSIVRFGIDELLPPEVSLLHGPGCPVCVTPVEMIDKAIAIASQPGVILCSFGDMLRVPGTTNDLLSVRATGGDVRMVYSPLDAVRLAQENSEKEVVFFAVGFETTAPANALAVHLAKERGLRNFSALVSHVLVPPAIAALLESEDCPIDGFLAAGHVCTVMGTREYQPLVDRFRIPMVVTGFEPVDLIQGIFHCICQLEAGRFCLDNPYSRAVVEAGNPHAQAMMQRVFEVCDRKWRGIGTIPKSGLRLNEDYGTLDAERRFAVEGIRSEEDPECVSGLVLQGRVKPRDCPAFGTRCTPEHPLGATMVSAEGACAAYYEYRKE